jgi:hypothetical protein
VLSHAEKPEKNIAIGGWLLYKNKAAVTLQFRSLFM